MLILGLDPGSLHTGYGFVEKHGSHLTALDAGRFSCPRALDLPRRLAHLAGRLDALVAGRRPDLAVLETPFHGMNARSLVVLAQAREGEEPPGLPSVRCGGLTRRPRQPEAPDPRRARLAGCQACESRMQQARPRCNGEKGQPRGGCPVPGRGPPSLPSAVPGPLLQSFPCQGAQVRKAIKPLHLDKEGSTEIYRHGDAWVSTVRRLRQINRLPQALLFAVKSPKINAKRLAAADEICRELESLDTVTIPFGESDRILEFARV